MEQETPQPAAETPHPAEEPKVEDTLTVGLRAAIRAATEEGRYRDRTTLQAQYRALPLEVRRDLITAERVDERSGRRIVRACVDAGRLPEPRARDAGAAATSPTLTYASSGLTLYGHFAVFDTWTEVDSFWEGHFMEQIAPGAFARTITESRSRIRVTFNHGRDVTLGDKILGPLTDLHEDTFGAAYEVPLLRGIPELVLEGLKADVYGASFRFYVMAERFVENPKPSAANPRGLPERTLLDVELEELGPVSFPQYPEATAHVRSLASITKSAAGTGGGAPRAREGSTKPWPRSLL